MSDLLSRNVHWWPTGNPARPWAVLFEGVDLEIAVTPGSGYVLLVGGNEEVAFAEWPSCWTMAPDDAANASQRAEYEHEARRLETRGVKPLTKDDLES